MRRLPIVLIALALVAGCGGDDSGDGGGTEAKPQQSGGGPQAAQALIDCFRTSGYVAVEPKPGEESLFALQAKRKGYDVTPVNVQKEESIAGSAFLAFFGSQEEAKKAMDELAVTSAGDVPPQQLGRAVIGYLDEQEKASTEKGIRACLS